jgi:arylsulfatase A-like enzyme
VSLCARVVTALSVGAAAWVCWRTGGASDPREKAPSARAAEPSAADLAAAAPGGAYEVHTRLIEKLPAARYDAPAFREATKMLADHWRKMPLPWSTLPPEDAKRVTSIALRTSATETQWSMPKNNGGAWEPDARVWNMNEGSFDQRESILAPTPSSVVYRLELPAAPRLTFSTATAAGATVSFAVTLVDARGRTHELYSKPSSTPGWTEASIDLSAFGGQSVELRLTTAAPGAGVGLWGNPTILARAKTKVPYNVLFVVIDALRPDVVASFHDDEEDEAKLHAPRYPQEALLPKVPGLMPNIDVLAQRGVRFMHAWSGGAWTRPGTLSMLAGARSTELGIDTLAWVLPESASSRFYASDPPLLPLLFRRQRVTTRAFVNNYFMVGYAPVGIDMGFERVDDHRYRTRDTMEITRDAVEWLRANKDERFFLFCNYNSPHEPWEPPASFEARVPPYPRGPGDYITRRYMAEAAKDDEALGVLLHTLDDLGLRDDTIVVVTADHGETLSAAHAGTLRLDNMPVRYHHAVSNYEETARIPILIAGPGMPAGAVVKARVRNTDIAPTLLELEGLEQPAKMSGRSLVALARGQTEVEPRVVVTEGRGTRAILWDKWRLLLREGSAKTTIFPDKQVTTSEELYDLVSDPGERHDLAKERPDVVAELRARLEAAQKRVPVSGAAAVVEPAKPWVRLRFAGAGVPHRIQGTVEVPGRVLAVRPVGVGPEAVHAEGARLEIAFTTLPDAVTGFDVQTDGGKVGWKLTLDDRPIPESAVFGGRFGVAAPSLRDGIVTEEARAAAAGSELPYIDPQRDLGMFVVRERAAEPGAPGARTLGAEAGKEMTRLLREWGYARGSGVER